MNAVKGWLRGGARNWTALLCFEILYQSIGLGLTVKMLDRTKSAVLRFSGLSFISQENLWRAFQSPVSVLCMLTALALFTYYVYFEIAALIIYCDAGWRGETISAGALWKKTFGQSIRIFHYRNLPVALLLLPVIALSDLPLSASVIRKFQMPEYILGFIRNTPSLSVLFIAFLTVLNGLMFFYLFCFPAVILQGKRLIGSFRTGVRLLEGRKRKTAALLLCCLLLSLLLAAACLALLALALWAASQWQPAADGGKSLFRAYYARWSAVWAAVSGVLASVVLLSAVIGLYHRYRGDKPPEAPTPKRPPRAIWRSGLCAAASAALLAVLGQTGLAGDFAFAPSPDTLLVAHRAGASLAPENTLAALEQAVRDRADIAEIDVQQTRDGILIAMHDTGLRRTTGLDQKVWEADYDEVKGLDAGSFFSSSFSGERVPTLSEMLEAANGRIGLMIELKAAGHERGLVEETVRQIEAAGMERQCMLASMNLEILRRCKEAAPGIRTVYITALLFSDAYDVAFVDGYSVETSFLTAEMAARVQGKGKRIFAWTANTARNIQKALRLGADGLVTDNVRLAGQLRGHMTGDPVLEFLIGLLYPENPGSRAGFEKHLECAMIETGR